MIKRLMYITSFLFVSSLAWGASTPIEISESTTIAAEGIYIVAEFISSPGITISSAVTATGIVDLNLNGY